MDFFHFWGKRKGTRLGRKLLILILLGSSFLAVLGTLFQLYVDYRAEMRFLHGQLEQIRLSRLPSLSNSLWYLDEEQILAQLDGMLELRDIRYVRVFTPDGMELIRGADSSPDAVLIQEYPLIFHGLERSERIGTLVVAVDKQALYGRLVDRVLIILATQGVQTFLVSVFILAFFFRLITRHLWRMAEYAEHLSLDRLPAPLVLDKANRPGKSDEIDMVVDALNGMLENLKRDIRMRLDAETRLKRAEGSLRDILDSMPSTLVAVDQDGRVIRWNRQALAATGLGESDLEGRFFDDVFPELPVRMRQILDAIVHNAPSKLAKSPQIKDGETTYHDITIYPLASGGMRGAVIRLDDVTDRVRLEEMMVQSEKMLSVGGLAAGMAHEINNPLAGILQNLQVLRNRLTEDLPANRVLAEELGFSLTQLREYLDRRGCARMLDSIAESGQRAAKIVANMLSFSRKSTSRLASIDICSLLDRTLELASNDYDLKKQYDFRKIEIVREYEDDVPLIPCEESKIQQVFFNLIRNGAQAMAAAGIEHPRFVLRVYRSGGDLCIEIEDNGPGMTEAIRRRVFEPFFTTKAVGEGTGLGLSVSYFIIVENHGGTLDVESAPGRGSVFTITLPVAVRVHVVDEA